MARQVAKLKQQQLEIEPQRSCPTTKSRAVHQAGDAEGIKAGIEIRRSRRGQ